VTSSCLTARAAPERCLVTQAQLSCRAFLTTTQRTCRRSVFKTETSRMSIPQVVRRSSLAHHGTTQQTQAQWETHLRELDSQDESSGQYNATPLCAATSSVERRASRSVLLTSSHLWLPCVLCARKARGGELASGSCAGSRRCVWGGGFGARERSRRQGSVTHYLGPRSVVRAKRGARARRRLAWRLLC
jgi:hypothetical protein